MVFNSLPSVTQELNNFFHQINKLTRFARSFVYFCEKKYLIPSLLRVRELKTICFFPSVSNDTFKKCRQIEVGFAALTKKVKKNFHIFSGFCDILRCFAFSKLVWTFLRENSITAEC